MCAFTFVVNTVGTSCFWYDPGIHMHNMRIKYYPEAASGMLLVCVWAASYACVLVLRIKAHRYGQQTVPEASWRVLSFVHGTTPYRRIVSRAQNASPAKTLIANDSYNDARFRTSGNAVHCCRVADWRLAALTLFW